MKREIKILAIDREEIILKSISKALKSDGEIDYQITTCNTALDGLKLIRSNKFNLVFIDLVLPGMDGFEVLRRIKNIDSSIPVIIMTGFSPVNIQFEAVENESSRDKALNNAAGFLLKPFTTEEIKSLIFRVLK
jgi:DNA-binding NtrC family response regulator